MTENRALTEITSSIVAAYVSNNSVSASAIGQLVGQVYGALARLGAAAEEPEAEKPKPAVNPKKSVFPDHIVCLEDGKKFKSLKRHLRVSFGLSPEDYREKWGLPADYPMVSPNYAAERSSLALKLGLGRKAGAVAPAAPVKRKSTPKPRA
ncbi:MucR family transcriptional regulator [Kaistia algarum]|uniref:MucR family transcriptional regulator n=1 Tax=Kaistia algarum TaxID=2083279 RepID=UPI000CE8EC07|nr:MucR family transcriptional regulator [Kaistia algarum]MCX5516324.1 MucR family transcriptional regulator [Kaistia algarum]PPE78755.1 MucR family transcriptional regulator [Kaistia algarum]